MNFITFNEVLLALYGLFHLHELQQIVEMLVFSDGLRTDRHTFREASLFKKYKI